MVGEPDQDPQYPSHHYLFQDGQLWYSHSHSDVVNASFKHKTCIYNMVIVFMFYVGFFPVYRVFLMNILLTSVFGTLSIKTVFVFA